jgi:hypothetical protein
MHWTGPFTGESRLESFASSRRQLETQEPTSGVGRKIAARVELRLIPGGKQITRPGGQGL